MPVVNVYAGVSDLLGVHKLWNALTAGSDLLGVQKLSTAPTAKVRQL